MRTQFSRFYNQAVLEELRARGETECFVAHSSAEASDSPCSTLLAGNHHPIAVLHERLLANHSRGQWDQSLKVPNHPHCTHVVSPSTRKSK